jgi:hypothetical protein
MSIHPYEHTYAYLIPMISYEKLNRLNLKIHKVDHQECFALNIDIGSH